MLLVAFILSYSSRCSFGQLIDSNFTPFAICSVQISRQWQIIVMVPFLSALALFQWYIFFLIQFFSIVGTYSIVSVSQCCINVIVSPIFDCKQFSIRPILGSLLMPTVLGFSRDSLSLGSNQTYSTQTSKPSIFSRFCYSLRQHLRRENLLRCLLILSYLIFLGLTFLSLILLLRFYSPY